MSEDKEKIHGGSMSFTGQKRLKTLQVEFTEKFPHLGLQFFSKEEYANTEKGLPAKKLDSDRTIASLRTKQNAEDLSLHGRTLIGNFESKFAELYGIYVQVCAKGKDGKVGYTGASFDGLTLSDANKRMEAAGNPQYTN